jgi:predicted nucleic acid-binding protein
LKELSYVLGDELFIENISTFLHSGNFIKAKLTNQEYIESKWIHKVNKNIGFFDVTHMLLAKKTKTILVTRDKELLELCKKYNVQTKTPEEVLSFR